MDVLRLLKDKCLLLAKRPITMVHSKSRYGAIEFERENLVFREACDRNFDGFASTLDIVSAHKRKLAKKVDAEIAAFREYEIKRFG